MDAQNLIIQLYEINSALSWICGEGLVAIVVLIVIAFKLRK